MSGADELDLVALRSVATGVAYRMLGSVGDAEDVAQEAVLRVIDAARRGEVRSPDALVTTAATRLAIDVLRSARVRREEYVGPWLPEPIVEHLPGPATSAELADSLSMAFLTVLEALSPLERAALLLHDAFAYDYDEVAEVLERSPEACRQLVSRARRHLRGGRAPRPVDPGQHRRLLTGFLAAARHGDVDALAALLADDVVLVSDGGAAVKAARHPIVGRDRVLRFLRVVGPSALDRQDRRLVEVPVNGEPGFAVVAPDRVVLAGAVEVDGGAVVGIRWVLNPAKLRHVVVDGPASVTGP